MRIELYFQTLRHLRPVQVRGQLRRRFWPVTDGRPRALRREPGVRRGLGPIAHIAPQAGILSEDGTFNFLNSSARLQGHTVNWAAPGTSRLWRYNLHYFDYLLDAQLSEKYKARLLDDWIEHNPPGTVDAWDAYPVSLRIVNWVKYFLGRPAGTALPRPWLTSLDAQADWLSRNFEYHLLGNHLLKNSVGLFFAGAFFEGIEADGWLLKGWKSLVEQVHEQFLGDGGHYERSPMYHSLCLDDALDALILAEQEPVALHVKADGAVLGRLRCAAEFLRDLCLPDEEIPLFNDAALGIAAAPRILLARARTFFSDNALALRQPSKNCQLIQKPASGYFGFRHGNDMLVVDCGMVGPDYQPGHAHCDTLSYELTLEGSRVVVDAGVHDYEMGARRALSRTTAGHNTVMVDDCEQSELWGTFRVGRRARPLSAMLHPHGPGCTFEGAHDGYSRLPGRPIHHRRISYDGVGAIEVWDEITGRGVHAAASRVRLHPDYVPDMYDSYALIRGRTGGLAARIEFLGGSRAQLEQGLYFPQFGVQHSCAVLVLRAVGPLPLRLGYRILKAGI